MRELPPALTLWPPQVKARAAFHAALSAGRTSGLLVMPTGSGKTITILTAAGDLGLPTLVLVHRDELIRQTVRASSLAWPEATVGVVQAGRDEWAGGQQIVVASVASLRVNRLDAMPRDRFGLVVVDEARHTAADGYDRVLTHFSPRRFLLGVKATPDRLDGVRLCRWYGEAPLFAYPVREAVNDGVLCKVRHLKVFTGQSLNAVRTYKGDFAEERLAAAVNTPARNRIVVEAYRENAAERRGVAFCVNVQHARDLAGAFQAAGVASACETGAMSPVERAETLEAFAAGEIDVVTTCQVLTEGFDDPAVDCIVMARPTASRGLYVQCIGRGLRRHGGKDDCLVLDVTDNCDRHKLVTVTDLADADTRSAHPGVVGEAPGATRAVAGMVTPAVLEWSSRSVSPWHELPTLDGYRPSKSWHSGLATPRQLDLLDSMHLRPACPLTKGEASHLIDLALAMQPATGRQRRFLVRCGAWEDGLTKKKAGELISRLKAG